MCLILNSKWEKSKIAEGDILVYKKVDFYLNKPFGTIQTGYWYSKKESAFLLKHNGKVFCGLHSYKFLCGNSIWKIPKGAKYYENEFEYASNKLEFVGFKDYNSIIKVEWNPKSPTFFKKLFSYLITYAELLAF